MIFARAESYQDGRPCKDTYFMGLARQAATRATCKRRKVGAVVVLNGHVVATGYNGAPKKQKHCIEVGCDIEHGHCVRTVHAEANAVIHAGHDRTEGATLYTTASPCRSCMMLIMNAGIARVVYAEPYKDASHQGDRSRWALEAGSEAGIEMVHLWAPQEVPPALCMRVLIDGSTCDAPMPCEGHAQS